MTSSPANLCRTIVEPVAGVPAIEALIVRAALEQLPAVLDSAGGPAALSRWTVLAFAPYQVLAHNAGRTTVTSRGGTVRQAADNPFTALRAALAEMPASDPGQTPQGHALPDAWPINGAVAIGHMAYELGRWVEHLPATAARDIALPEVHWAFYDSALVIDGRDGSARIVATDAGGRDPAELLARWRGVLDDAGAATSGAGAAPAADDSTGAARTMAFDDLSCNFTRDAYLRAVARTIEYIAAGDIFQANLSQRFTAPLAASPAELYLRLRRTNPAPFAAYLSGEGWAVLSSSPERFLRLSDRHVETRPIKGTRRRYPDDEPASRRSRAELLASEKDAAELAMIVDLERNDLGRVCSFGSVRVTEPRTIEPYASVYHSVAQVEGRLHDGLDLADLLRATFPGGSITGAPKVRAMEIIDQLEPTCRSVYTGTVGYITAGGRAADLNIAIRTLLADGDRVHLQVGGGIVADSTPEAEYDETLAKARSLLAALGVTI